MRIAGPLVLLATGLIMTLPASAVELHGHRGARGLVPENTLASFRAALAHGVDCIEIDIGMSRDGVLVIHHDRALNPVIARDGAKWITAPVALKSLDYAQIARFDVGRLKPGTPYAAKWPAQVPADGARIPRLGDMLAMAELAEKIGVCLNIEVKTSPEAPDETFPPERISAALVAELDRHGFRNRVRIQSFDWRNLTFLANQAPDIPLSFLTAEQDWLDNVRRRSSQASPWLAGANLAAFDGLLPAAIKRLGGRIWAPYHRDIGANDVAAAHGLGLKVIVWTVNDASDMRRAMRLGVDGLITDYPDVGAAEIRAAAL